MELHLNQLSIRARDPKYQCRRRCMMFAGLCGRHPLQPRVEPVGNRKSFCHPFRVRDSMLSGLRYYGRLVAGQAPRDT